MSYWSLRTHSFVFLLYVNPFVIDNSQTCISSSHQQTCLHPPVDHWGNTLFTVASAVSPFINSGHVPKANNIASFPSITCLWLHKPKWLVLQRQKWPGGRLSAKRTGDPARESFHSSSYLIMRAADPWVYGFILPPQWLANKLRWVPQIDMKPSEVAMKRQNQKEKEGRRWIGSRRAEKN